MTWADKIGIRHGMSTAGARLDSISEELLAAFLWAIVTELIGLLNFDTDEIEKVAQ